VGGNAKVDGGIHFGLTQERAETLFKQLDFKSARSYYHKALFGRN
jgi:hypothetical protein